MFGLSFKLAISGFLSKPISRTFVILTVSFILLVGAIMFMLMQSFNHALSDVKSSRFMTAYLESTMPADRENEVVENVKRIKGVDSVQIVSKDAFMDNFSKYFPQLSKDVGQIDEEAIPRYLKIKADDESAAVVSIDVKKVAGIESVEPHERRFSGLINALVTLRRFAILLLFGAMTALVSLLFNHFKVDTLHRTQVITTMQLMGAGKMHAYMPFLIEGLIEGLLGGIIAAVMLVSASKIFNAEVNHFFSAIGYRFYEISVPPVGIVVVFIGLTAGIVGSLWATGITHKKA